MIELQDINLLEYLELENREEYDFAIKYAKALYNDPVDIYNIGDFTELEFGLIKDLQFDIGEGLTWIKLIEYMEKITGISEKKLALVSLVKICQFRTYILNEIERINLIESQLLGHMPDATETEAGINEFDKFGSYPQIRRLANENVLNIEPIRKQKYSICLLELCYQKTDADFKERYSNIKYKNH